MKPSERQISRWVDRFRSVIPARNPKKPLALSWDELEERLQLVRQRDERDASIVLGYPTTTSAGGRGGAELTSVESAANQRAFAGTGSTDTQDRTGTQARDELHELAVNAFGYMQDAVQAFNACVSTLEQIERRAEPSKPVGHTVAHCAENKCEDIATKRGRCEACYMWQYRWAANHGVAITEAPAVPESVINERVMARENRRVHVTGPLADPAA